MVARNSPPNWLFGIGNLNSTVWMCLVFTCGIGNQFRGHPRAQLTYSPLDSEVQTSELAQNWRTVPRRSHSRLLRARRSPLPRLPAPPPAPGPPSSPPPAAIRRPWPPSSLPPLPRGRPLPAMAVPNPNRRRSSPPPAAIRRRAAAPGPALRGPRAARRGAPRALPLRPPLRLGGAVRDPLRAGRLGAAGPGGRALAARRWWRRSGAADASSPRSCSAP